MLSIGRCRWRFDKGIVGTLALIPFPADHKRWANSDKHPEIMQPQLRVSLLSPTGFISPPFVSQILALSAPYCPPLPDSSLVSKRTIDAVTSSPTSLVTIPTGFTTKTTPRRARTLPPTPSIETTNTISSVVRAPSSNMTSACSKLWSLLFAFEDFKSQTLRQNPGRAPPSSHLLLGFPSFLEGR